MLVHASERKRRKEKPWNRCDFCGKFISVRAFEIGMARRYLLTPDSAFTTEEFRTVCPDCMTYDE